MIQARIPEIHRISPEYRDWGNSVTHGRNTFTRMVSASLPTFETMRSHYAEAGGRFLNDIDIDKDRRVAFLGHKVAQSLFGGENPVGKTVSINEVPFLVIGVMIDKMQMSMYNGPDADKVVIPLSTYRLMRGTQRVNRIIYAPRDPATHKEVEGRVREVLAAKYRFEAGDERALNFWDVIQQAREMNLMFLGIQMFLKTSNSLIVLIAVLIGAILGEWWRIEERLEQFGKKLQGSFTH